MERCEGVHRLGRSGTAICFDQDMPHVYVPPFRPLTCSLERQPHRLLLAGAVGCGQAAGTAALVDGSASQHHIGTSAVGGWLGGDQHQGTSLGPHIPVGCEQEIKGQR